jgi:hypothetical protein
MFIDVERGRFYGCVVVFVVSWKGKGSLGMDVIPFD